jgi:dihydrofolate reductase
LLKRAAGGPSGRLKLQPVSERSHVGQSPIRIGRAGAKRNWLGRGINQAEWQTMAKLIYIAITSLDGYVEDETGRFDWAVPDEEVHTFVNDLLRPVGTYLYGRRMYETMAVWETMDTAAQEPFTRDFAEIWRAADKIVYSKTLEMVSSARTRIERDFDPEAVRRTKMLAGRDITVAGASLAAHAIKRRGWWTSTT